MNGKLAFLGPEGTYTEQAAVDYGPEATLVSCPSIPAVAMAVEAGEAGEGVVPIENSLGGSVTDTLDLLIHDSSLSIRHELVVQIDHCLVVNSGTEIESIQVVYSHPQALAQCRRFLGERLPGASLVAALSTAASVREMQESNLCGAAIASRRAAALNGASVLVEGIQDDRGNATRFVVLAPADNAPTGRDKTSICFDFEQDAPGMLYTVLGEFARRGINMTKIESRPTRATLGRYIFLLDAEGHREEGKMKEALQAVRAQVSMYKVLGSYPAHVSSSV